MPAHSIDDRTVRVVPMGRVNRFLPRFHKTAFHPSLTLLRSALRGRALRPLSYRPRRTSGQTGAARALRRKGLGKARRRATGGRGMKDFSGKIAVITGGGTGMGRELALQLVAEGCNVAMCDVSAANMAETQRLALQNSPQGVRVTTHIADVSLEDRMNHFRDEVAEQMETDKIHLLFNNAGVGGGGSFVNTPRAEWERTFNICWGGVYYGCRAFLPMLMRANEAHIINTSSVNGFWASLGPQTAHTAYSAAKFAVKGFTEALINDLKINAPHIKCSVVMPGHIGTDIAINSRKVLAGGDGDAPVGPEAFAAMRRNLARMGIPGADQI